MPNDSKRYRFRYKGQRYAVYYHTKKELVDKVDAKKKLIDEQCTNLKDISVIKWRDEWLELYKKDKVTPPTYSSYRSILNRLNLVLPVKDVRPAHLQKILNDMEGMSDSLIHKFIVLTKELFESAVDNDICKSNPARKLSVPRGVTHQRRPLTLSERQLIERVAPKSAAGRYVALMLYAGCRPGEAGIIQGKDINLKEMLLHIRGTKTKTADRYVPITSKLLPYLDGIKKDEYAVKNCYNEKSTKDSRHKLWKRFIRELNIESGCMMGRPKKNTPHDIPLENLMASDLQPYVLRHTFCTDLEAAGVPINVARDFMGHSSITITSKIYTHRSDAALQDAARKMDSYHPELRIVAGSKQHVQTAPATAPPTSQNSPK